MILSDEETIDIIRNLLLLHAPASLDRQHVLDKLQEMDSRLFLSPAPGCRDCGAKMVCINCDEIDVQSQTTISVNGKEIYSN